MASYSYSPVWRLTEYLGIGAFFVLVGLLGYEAWLGLSGPFAHTAWWLIPTALVTAVLVADFISGLFHFLADNFGHEEMPILGPNVIRPFREHHVDPKAMTHHDFVELNGNNCLICVPALIATYMLVPAQEQLWGVFFVLFFAVFVLGIFMTNQFHKWSHLDEPPGWLAWLQERSLVLSPEHHQVHHTAPFDRYYCITTGWMNPVLEAVGFWSRSEALIRRVTGSKRPEPIAPPKPTGEPTGTGAGAGRLAG